MGQDVCEKVKKSKIKKRITLSCVSINSQQNLLKFLSSLLLIIIGVVDSSV